MSARESLLWYQPTLRLVLRSMLPQSKVNCSTHYCNQLFTYTSCTFYCETLEGRNYVSFILASSENNVVPTSEEASASASGMMASRMEGVSFWHTVLSLI